MTLRTISQLEPITDAIVDTSLIEASVPQNNSTYKSQSLTFLRLKTAILDFVGSSYALSSNIGADIQNQINYIENGDITFGGNKSFNNAIQYTTEPSYPSTGDENYIATKGYIDSSIATNVGNIKVYVKSTSSRNAYVSPYLRQFSNHKNTGESDLIMWKLDKKGDGYIGSYSDACNITDTGYLVVYGYVAAPKTVNTAYCWVALEAYVNGKWIAIQIQPWIVGSKSTYMQYVGFNAPVSGPIDVRITCGFEPSGESTGYGNSGLVYSQDSGSSTGTMNIFYGYVIH